MQAVDYAFWLSEQRSTPTIQYPNKLNSLIILIEHPRPEVTTVQTSIFFVTCIVILGVKHAMILCLFLH